MRTSVTIATLLSLCALPGCDTGDPADSAAVDAAPSGGAVTGVGQGSGGTAGTKSSDAVKTDTKQPVLNLKEPEVDPEEVVMMEEEQVTEPKTEVVANCAATKVEALDTTVLVPADIIIAVDMSSSMAVEVGFVQQQLNSFSEQIIASGVDVRVILIATPRDNAAAGLETMCIDPPLGSGDCAADSLLPGYLHVEQHVGSNDALNQIIDTYPQWSAQLRPDAIKAFFVVSDDDATAIPNDNAATFTTNLEALDPEMFLRWNMNAVYSFSLCTEPDTVDADGETVPGAMLAARIGFIYEELVAQTGGVEGDLCLQDFQSVFDALATQIVDNAGAEIVCEWEIPTAVEGQTFSTDLVGVTRTSGDAAVAPEALNRVLTIADCAAGGWHFDDNYDPTRIIACESTCAGMQDDEGGGIEVAFGCEVVEGCTASGETALVSVEEVVAPAVACSWVMPEAGDLGERVDPATVNVSYTSHNGFSVLLGAVPGPDDCATAELGWYYDDLERPTMMVACPQTCEILTARELSNVNGVFGCETKPAPPVR